jgi:lipoyl(octanoyl) transferase
MNIVKFHNLGIQDYKEVWDFQEKLFNEVIQSKKEMAENQMNHLIFCQHPHVYTLGRSGDEQNLLLNYIQLQANNASFYKINRGGDITYHGPGQLVGYPIFNLTSFSIGLKEYIHLLEEAIIQSVAAFNIKAERLEGATGVWLDTNNPRKIRKISAIGVRSSHWVTMHGFALNVNTDLNYFSHINPCGFTDKAVTSIEKELGEKVNFEEVSMIIKNKLKELFNFDFSNI